VRVRFLEPPQEVLDLLDRRRRWGADRWDEMWDGVLHVVPMPSGLMQRFNTNFLSAVAPLAKAKGLRPYYTLGLFRAEDDYREPRQSYCRPEQIRERGAEGAELVLEIRFPGDEAYEKIDFYSERGVREMLVVHPEEGRIELFRAVGGRLIAMQPGPDGEHTSEVLGITLRTVDGKLEITWDGGSATV
jgi:Putative restriction endonuclease